MLSGCLMKKKSKKEEACLTASRVFQYLLKTHVIESSEAGEGTVECSSASQGEDCNPQPAKIKHPASDKQSASDRTPLALPLLINRDSDLHNDYLRSSYCVLEADSESDTSILSDTDNDDQQSIFSTVSGGDSSSYTSIPVHFLSSRDNDLSNEQPRNRDCDSDDKQPRNKDSEANLHQWRNGDSEANLDQPKNGYSEANLDQRRNRDSETNLDQQRNRNREANLDQRRNRDSETNLDQRRNRDSETNLDQQRNRNREANLDQRRNTYSEANLDQQRNRDSEANLDQRRNTYSEANLDQRRNTYSEAKLDQQRNCDSKANLDGRDSAAILDRLRNRDYEPSYCVLETDSDSNNEEIIDNNDDLMYVPPTISSSISGRDYESDSDMFSDREMETQNDQPRRSVFVPETDSEISSCSTTYPVLQKEIRAADSMSSPRHSACTVTVLSSSKKKFSVCVYCKKQYQKLPRHLTTMHETEDAVREYMNCSDKSEKDQHLYRLRNLGNHQHNINVLQEGRGFLVVNHCPSSKDADPEDFVPCPTCYGYFRKTLLYKHCCPMVGTSKQKGTQKVRRGKLLLASALKKENEGFTNFLQTFRRDSVSIVAKTDSLIAALTEAEFDRNGHDEDIHNYIRTKARETARLLIEIRSITGQESASLSQFISPDKVEVVMQATRHLCGFQQASQTYSNPSLALKLGHNIKKCAVLLKACAIRELDHDKQSRVNQFLDLVDIKWNVKVSHHAHRTLHNEKRNKPCLLPIAEDVLLLSEHLQKTAATCIETLQTTSNSSPSCAEAWSRLNQATLAHCILFNRRRQGEVSKMKLQDFKSHMTDNDQTAVACGLSETEKALCASLTRVEIAGKRGNTVPVLLTPIMKRAVDILVEKREEMGISKENPFLFARLNFASLQHIRGTDCLRNEAALCGAKQPDVLRSTRLRKQIATLTQVINMKENEMDILAKFLGHDINVHRNFYRLPERALQAAKVSKLLFCMEKGTISKFAGKSLDEVMISSEDVLEESPPGSQTPAEAEQDEDTTVSSSFPHSEPQEILRETPSGSQTPGATAVEDQANTSSDSDTLLLPEKPQRSRVKRRKWSKEETAAVRKHLTAFIVNRSLPGKTAIEQVKRKEDILANRSWRNIKDHFRNTFL